ncbi:hypothetical protein VST7929_03273 [Vibrio stylophorae]|uniref:Bile acid:sodium symporter n=1 Tax=Vibrio stylophorae TaxID=659351 RepID=A0ABN8DY86_9VIBR|nr:bile acid:sodium symporter family protein [Vibrio stylophorae]CAH0535799.1 hypothetical protein VST7929_03273 [Vibrio stylophorae]
MSYLFRQRFLIMLLTAITLGILLPSLGEDHGWLHLNHFVPWGIALIFFLHGFHLAPQTLWQGFRLWRYHLWIQTITFALFPILGILLSLLTRFVFNDALQLGWLYLAVLPGTISSAVAMTSLAKGNVSLAIFNASFSSLLGIVFTPLWMALFFQQQQGTLDLNATLISIGQQVALPMLLGQLLRPLLHRQLSRFSSWTNEVDKVVIAFIVLNAFSNASSHQLWQQLSWLQMLLLAGFATLLLGLMLGFIWQTGRWFGIPRDNLIATLFCGSKKSLAAGIPMAKVIFVHQPQLGLILLPIMLYHQIQLFCCAWLAQYLGRHTDVTGTDANMPSEQK